MNTQEWLERRALSETTRLRLMRLDRVLDGRVGTPNHRLAYLRDKLAMKARIRTLEEGGRVAVVESGRDCDGVEYWGHVHIIEATIRDFEELYDQTEQYADGPFYFTLMRPSEAREVKAESRDRGMEAFEDGHAHCIFSSF